MGYIYILTNPSFKDYIKIGYADNVDERLKVLNSSSAVPFSFVKYATYEVSEKLTDKILHEMIDMLNPDLRAIEEMSGKKRVREFYEMSPEDGYKILQAIAGISGTKDRLIKYELSQVEKQEAVDASEREERRRAESFSFEKCDIPIGSPIKYIYNPDLIIVVAGDKRVTYGEITTSLTSLAKLLEEQRTGKEHKSLQGTLYFTYNDKLLNDIRIEKMNDK